MSEYTIEELERMLEEARLNEIENNQIIESYDDIQINEILMCNDLEDISIFSNDSYNTIIRKMFKSQSLNKIIVIDYNYIEEIENDQIVGRRCVGNSISYFQYNEQIPNESLIVVSQTPAERG